ncbi:MAG TPA: hypothetical protein VK923_19380 [Euzebyales bacterium]|nr:hypothetical protein [Euzebyales bacterium]
MSIALRELLRRPARFAPVVAALSLLVLLLVVLGGYLDGLTLDQTGALRAQGDVAFVSTADAELLPDLSLVGEDVQDRAAGVDGATAVGGLSRITTTATMAGEIVDVVAYGYDTATIRRPGASLRRPMPVARSLIGVLLT